jgi:hypothetical protein
MEPRGNILFGLFDAGLFKRVGNKIYFEADHLRPRSSRAAHSFQI